MTNYLQNGFPRRTKEKRSIGSKRPKGEPHTSLKPRSDKQKVRDGQIRTMKQAALNKMHELYGMTFCMGVHDRRVLCSGPFDWDHVRPKGRHGIDVDSPANGQILCRAHHEFKTRTPGMYDFDFRLPEIKKMMEELNA